MVFSRFRAGFLWWLSHMRDRPCRIVAVPQMARQPADRLAERFDRDEPLRPQDRARYREEWRRLQDEAAPMRVIENGELVSAPVDCFNAHLLATTSTEWLHTARIVGRTLESLLANSGHVVGDLFLMNRLLALVDAGILEWQDNGKDIRRCKVRLRSE